jgi:phenylalanyl-tRNA synthetase beta chain
MRVPCRWLAEYVELGLDAEPILDVARRIGDRLTLAGIEVEGYEVVPAVHGLVVGRVLRVADHPRADQLSVCDVDTGDGTRRIVCGAPNVAAEQLVPVILPGARLPGGLEIGVRTLRGVESHGMICSKAELGLEEKSPGIWPLDSAWALEPGADLDSALEFDDVILDISLTSNRPDLLGFYGLARELATLLRQPLTPLASPLEESDPPTRDEVAVELEDPRDTPRYCARLFRGIRVGPSPLRIQHRLAKAGMRPRSNVVDATNYVMLELGHPLHPFDADRVADRIVVRRARDGERFRTLDGIEHALTKAALLITDGREPIALAGIMGGERSEIRPETDRVLLEAAVFDHGVIRHAARALGLRTEASLRFGRGLDPDGVETASRRAAHWIQALAGGTVHRGCADAYPYPRSSTPLRLRPAQVERLLGIEVPDQDIVDILARLGLAPEWDDDRLLTTIPSRRDDLRREADLVEEIGRIHGYDKVPSEPPRALLRAGRKDPRERLKNRVQDLLVGLGMDEAVGDGFARPEWSDAMGYRDADRIHVRNPMLDSQSALRAALLPGLLTVVEDNIHQGTDGGMLFEVGRAFPRASGERDAVAGVLFGRTHRPLRGKETVSVLHAKGLLFSALGALRVPDPRIDPAQSPPFIESGRGGAITAAGLRLGVFGALARALVQRLAIPTEMIVFELDLDAVAEAAAPPSTFVAMSRFPASKRDLSLLVPPGVAERQVRDILAAPVEVERLLLYDEYRGEQVGGAGRSLTYELVLRAPDRTLTDEDAAALVAQLETELKEIGVGLRR